jgi:TrmH family RNA methyltransferase
VKPVRSRRDPALRELRGLRDAGGRAEAGRFAVEGEDLVEAALAAGIVPVAALVDAERRVPLLERALGAVGCEVAVAEPELLAWASTLAHHARIAVVVEHASLPLLGVDSAAASVGVRLHGVADPGNVGTLIRSADVLGPAHVVLGEGTADPLGPKAVRASMGAVFRVPLVPLADAPSARRIALDARAGTALWDVELDGPVAFELGGERSGLPDTIVGAAEASAAIPLAPGGESLNVAMAGAIALYELRRRSS